MKWFSQFTVSHVEWDDAKLLARFHYHFDHEECFVEEIAFAPLKNQNFFPLQEIKETEIQHLLAHLHIALGVSYYKLYPTAQIIVNSLNLDAQQQSFWRTFYLKGLGEFFYQNQIDFRNLANFESSALAPKYDSKISLNKERDLLLFGGGKDSLVSAELLKKQSSAFDLFSFGQDYPLHALATPTTEAKRLIIFRTLDLQQLRKLTTLGYYDGHLPITGIISFVSLVVAYLYGYNRVVTSLEKSADEGNIRYLELEINHQWSKSLEFEQLFQNYVKNSISENFMIYSPLRNWYEIKVVKEFAQYPQYFYHFSSCNRNFHQTGPKLSADQLWCGVCPKCAFVYTMLRAFLDLETVNQIFGQDLFENADLIPLFEELLGISGFKPFECVGTNEEMILALWLIYRKEKNSESIIMQLFQHKILPEMSESAFDVLEEKFLG